VSDILISSNKKMSVEEIVISVSLSKF